MTTAPYDHGHDDQAVSPNDATVDYAGHDYYIEQVGPKVWVTLDGDETVLVFESTSGSEVAGAMKLLASAGLIVRAAFTANGGGYGVTGYGS